MSKRCHARWTYWATCGSARLQETHAHACTLLHVEMHMPCEMIPLSSMPLGWPAGNTHMHGMQACQQAHAPHTYSMRLSTPAGNTVINGRRPTCSYSAHSMRLSLPAGNTTMNGCLSTCACMAHVQDVAQLACRKHMNLCGCMPTCVCSACIQPTAQDACRKHGLDTFVDACPGVHAWRSCGSARLQETHLFLWMRAQVCMHGRHAAQHACRKNIVSVDACQHGQALHT